jgi:polysaccharide export outer membrane protein
MWILSWCVDQRHCRATSAACAGKSRFIKFSLLTASLTCWAFPALADYRIDVGDVIEITVARIPELQRRVPVKPDGRISFPLLGTYSVVGLAASEMEAKIQAALATKIFKQRLPDGREFATTIDPEDVTAIVAQYRPIYVNGDVAKPGEQQFRPLMTVRQAVALSGGYDMLRLRTENPLFMVADLKGEYQSLWVAFAKEQAHISRLKAELGDKDALDQPPVADNRMPSTGIAEIVAIEAEHLKVDQADHEREKAFLRRSVNKADEQIQVLETQEAKEEQGTQADAEELKRVLELFGKGALPSPRVTDARRAVLLSSTRKLQTAAQLMQIKKQEDEVARQLERVDDQRRIKLLQELQDARMVLGQVQAKLQSTSEKLQYAAARLPVGRANELRPDIALIRKGDKGHARIAADEDSELQPGDVVEVALRSD